LLDIKADLLAFVETAQTSLLHGADMDEDVLPPCIRRDEPVAFGRVEPLHGALGHSTRCLSACGRRVSGTRSAARVNRGGTGLPLSELPDNALPLEGIPDITGPGWPSTRTITRLP